MATPTVSDIEYYAKSIMEGSVCNEQWMFAFSGWLLDDDRLSILRGVLHRWNTDASVADDEEYLHIIVQDAMEAACVFLCDESLYDAFSGMDVDCWVRDFTGSLIKINI